MYLDYIVRVVLVLLNVESFQRPILDDIESNVFITINHNGSNSPNAPMILPLPSQDPNKVIEKART